MKDSKLYEMAREVGGFMEHGVIHAVCFTGHRPFGLPAGGKEDSLPMKQLMHQLRENIIAAMDRGATEFYAGGAAGFDTLAAETVIALRNEGRTGIRLNLALPGYLEMQEKWDDRQRTRYFAILNEVNDIYIAEDQRSLATAFLDRNRYMVDHADLVIAYLKRNTGGTYYTVCYARKNGVYVRNLCEQACVEPIKLI